MLFPGRRRQAREAAPHLHPRRVHKTGPAQRRVHDPRLLAPVDARGSPDDGLLRLPGAAGDPGLELRGHGNAAVAERRDAADEFFRFRRRCGGMDDDNNNNDNNTQETKTIQGTTHFWDFFWKNHIIWSLV